MRGLPLLCIGMLCGPLPPYLACDGVSPHPRSLLEPAGYLSRRPSRNCLEKGGLIEGRLFLEDVSNSLLGETVEDAKYIPIIPATAQSCLWEFGSYEAWPRRCPMGGVILT